MKKISLYKCKTEVKSVIEVTDFKQAVILRYFGHDIQSIQKHPQGTIFQFHFRRDTLSLLSDLSKERLMIEPIRFIGWIDDLKLLMESDVILDYLRKLNK